MHNYHLLEEKFDILFVLLEGVLTESEKQESSIFFDAGEYGITLETLCGILQDGQKSISIEAFKLIQELGSLMLLDNKLWSQLKVI